MKPLKTAVLGAGRWGRNLIRNVRRSRDLELAIVADVDVASLLDVDAPAVSNDPEHVLADPRIEAVVIATPPETHFPLASQALAAGKHVLCEKPLCLAVEQCRALDRLAVRSGLCLMVDCTAVYLDEVQRARKRIDWDSVRHVRCLRTSRRMPQNPSELLWDLAPHDLAVLHFWLGDSTADWQLAPLAGDLLRLEPQPVHGPQLEVLCGYSPSPAREIVIETDTATFRLLQQQTDPEPLQVVVSHFAQCIRTHTPPLTGVECAIQTARILSGVETCLASVT